MVYRKFCIEPPGGMWLEDAYKNTQNFGPNPPMCTFLTCSHGGDIRIKILSNLLGTLRSVAIWGLNHIQKRFLGWHLI